MFLGFRETVRAVYDPGALGLTGRGRSGRGLPVRTGAFFFWLFALKLAFAFLWPVSFIQAKADESIHPINHSISSCRFWAAGV